MRKTKIIWLVIATALVLIGAMIFAGVMSMLNWDFRKLSTVKYETNSYEISDSFKDISININTADITILPSDDTTTKVVCFEQVNIKHNVSVKDNTLCIEVNDTRKWYQYIGIDFYTSKITVYLPKGAYGELSVDLKTGDTKITGNLNFESIDITSSTGDTSINNTNTKSIAIKTSTGDITLSGISCQSEIKTSVTTGDVIMSNINCGIITSSGSTGDLKMTNVIANEKFSITRSTGDVTFNMCDAYDIYVRVTTGDVKGSLLSDKIFIAKTSTGDVSVPNSDGSGRCEITATTGDIIITVQK